jgi:hypothetical protein
MSTTASPTPLNQLESLTQSNGLNISIADLDVPIYRVFSLHPYAEAESLFKRALDIREKAFGPEHPDIAWSLNSLGALRARQSRFAEAESPEMGRSILRPWRI